MPRSLTSFSLSLVAFFATVAVGTANAKECKTDSDCASGFECILGKIAEGTGGNTGSMGGGGAGVGAAGGAVCAGPDCPASSPSNPIPTVPPPVPVDGGALVPQTDPQPRPFPDGGVAIAVPIPAPDAGLPIPVVTTGICQLKVSACIRKADCPANLDCVMDTAIANQPNCQPGVTCFAPNPPTGTCKAVCNVDSDCSSPLVCKLQGQACMGGGSVGPDGTVTTMPTTCSGGNKICSYQPVTCSTDAECKEPSYQCVKVQDNQVCTGSASAGCPKSTGAADVACTPTPAEPPVCTSVVVNNCLPKEIKCDAGQACPAGWTCFDFTNFDTVRITGWTQSPYGKTCLPDGFIQGIYGYAVGGYAFGGGVSNTAGYGRDGSGGTSGSVDVGGKGGAPGVAPVAKPGDSTPPQVTPVPSSDGQEHATAGDAGAEAVTSKVRGGGCSLGGVQGGSFDLWMTLGLAGLVLRLVRRRR